MFVITIVNINVVIFIIIIIGYAGALRTAAERILSNGLANSYVLGMPLAKLR